MFFILSKVTSFLFSPFTWIVVFLLIALFTSEAQRKKAFLATSLFLLFFFSNSFLFDECMRKWEFSAITEQKLDSSYDAAIILSGMITYDVSFDRIQFNRRNDRLMQAINLYKKGKVKKLFFSGGSGSLVHRDKQESMMVKPFLLTLGIPEEDIILETSSDNTYQNALYTVPILRRNFPEGKFLLITSAFHMRRAIACFQKQGITVTAFSTDRYSGPRKFQFDHLFLPNVETMYNWESLLHEWIGYVIYKLMGYL